MSAIREWFGIYNIIFRHMKDTFGEAELKEYLDYLGDTAYNDVSEDFKKNGLKRINERYKDNFVKDGGKVSSSLDGEKLEFVVEACPAYEYMLNSANPYDKPEKYFCDSCRRLNARILANAGYSLDISDINNNGRCRWAIASACLQKSNKGNK